MPFELQQVKGRIATMRQIRKVTSAMQQIATVRLAGDRRAMESSRRYTERLFEVLQDITPELLHVEHPLLVPRRKVSSLGLLAIGTDRGLCGGCNTLLIERLRSFVEAHEAEDINVITVGKIVRRRVRREGLTVVRSFSQPRRLDRGDTIDALTASVTESYLARSVDEFHILYLRFDSTTRQEPVVERLLPAPFELTRGRTSRVTAFEPEPAAILERLLPEFIRQAIDHAFLNSLASEDAARQEAMARASENANDVLTELTATYRRLRQESITTEMLELIGGGAFLK